jgi:putative oxidoreductase
MKKIFTTIQNTNLNNIWLLVFRALASILMLTHGYPKLLKMMEKDFDFPDPLGVGSVASLSLTVFSEFLCPILIMFGLATRYAGFAVAFTMGVAAFVIHAGDPIHVVEKAYLYLLVFSTIVVLGPGKFSIDALICPPKSKRR